MKSKLAVVFVISIISLIFPAGLFGQDKNKALAASSLYVISAKAGAVNYVAGKVSIEQVGTKKGFLQKGDTVEIGDRVSTQADGKAEVLLNPGSYIRLAENSEFEFISTSLDDLQIKINKGSAIFEVIADKEFKVAIATESSKFYLISSGIFRIDVLENGIGKISVWKGKAQVGDTKATIIKGGRTALFSNTQAVVEKFDRGNKGEFDLWSRDRAKDIAKINAKLVEKQMSQSLIHSFNRNGWGASSGYGLWVQDPFSRSFCFLPFGYGWSSPYGFGYNQSIWSYQLPRQIIAPMYQNPIVNNPNNGQNVMNPPQYVTPTGNMGNPNSQSPMQSQPQMSSPGINRGADERQQNQRPNIVERKERPIDN